MMDNSYKKRVTLLEERENSVNLKNAIVEYKGHFPVCLMHGNASKHTQPYMRTKTSTMEETSKKLLHNKPKKIDTDLLLQEDIKHAPRHSRQVRQKKLYDNKKANEDKLGTPKTRNLADNILNNYGAERKFIHQKCGL